MKKILNLAGGKLGPLPDVFDEHGAHAYVVNVDSMYQSSVSVAHIENMLGVWEEDICAGNIDDYDRITEQYVCEDVFEFMETCRKTFDVITVYRFLEHVPRDKVLYFIYLLSTTVKVGGYIDVIVPDYEILAKMLLTETPELLHTPMFEKHNIILSTEMLNEPEAPHASIWTPSRAFKFFELEERFVINQPPVSNFEFDGRNIYLRFSAVRIK